MKFKKVLLLVISLLITATSLTYAEGDQINLTVRDTVINRGNLNLIPISGKISVAEKKTLKIRIKFNAIVIDIKKAYGQANTAIIDAEPQVNINLDDLENAYIDITTDNYKNTDNGVICYLETEGLVAPDTITTLVPQVISLGDTVPNSVVTSGKVIVSGMPIFLAENESLENNFPNPFIERTTFKFRILKDSQVRFKIYSPEGRKVFDLQEYNENAKYKITDNQGNQIVNPESYTFTKGEYHLELTPIPWKFASGAYFMIMETDNGAYKTNFLYSK